MRSIQQNLAKDITVAQLNRLIELWRDSDQLESLATKFYDELADTLGGAPARPKAKECVLKHLHALIWTSGQFDGDAHPPPETWLEVRARKSALVAQFAEQISGDEEARAILIKDFGRLLDAITDKAARAKPTRQDISMRQLNAMLFTPVVPIVDEQCSKFARTKSLEPETRQEIAGLCEGILYNVLGTQGDHYPATWVAFEKNERAWIKTVSELLPRIRANQTPEAQQALAAIDDATLTDLLTITLRCIKEGAQNLAPRGAVRH